jgi:excisionase family DNA binding protein
MSHTQYSSFQIAKMLNVSRQAVNQWIDKGYIDSYRTPGGHRRVARRDLIAFLHSRNIPIPYELENSNSSQQSKSREPAFEIVMIDDDEDFLILVQQALDELIPNVRFRKYTNGLDGLIAIGAERPNLVLLDMRMPNLNGAEVVKRLKTNALTDSLPIIVITAYEEVPDVQVARKLKVEQVISKSRPLMEIARQIVQFVNKLRKVPA